MASTRIRHRKDGSVCYQVTCCSRDQNGKRHSYSKTWIPDPSWSEAQIQEELSAFTASFECEHIEARSNPSVLENDPRRSATPTLKAFYKSTFRPEKQKTCAINTVMAYDQLAKALENCPMWETPLSAIMHYNIQDFLKTLLNSGLHVNSVNLRRNQLTVIFQRAVDLGLLAENPVNKVKPFMRAKDDKNMARRSLTLHEAVLYLKAAEMRPLLWRTFLNLALDSGMRRGEMRGLLWCNVDFQSGIITVENNYQHGQNCKTKSGKTRFVQVGDDVISLLRELQDNQKGTAEYVFTNPETGKPYDEETVCRVMKEVGEEIGCPWLHCHSLRHTMATLSLAGGASLTGVSKRLGHLNTSTTSRYYVHPDNRESNEAGQCLRNLLGTALDKQ